MRVWVIFLLISLIAFVSAYDNRKSASKKDASISTAKKDKDDLPPLPLDSTDDDEEDEDPVQDRKSVKKTVKKKTKTQEEEEEEEETAIRQEEVKAAFCAHVEGVAECDKLEDAEDTMKKGRLPKPKNTDDPEVICTEEDNICICSQDEVDCHREDDEDRLETLNLVVLNKKNKKFKAETADFRRNMITMIKKGQILPGKEKEIKKLDLTHNKISKIEAGAFEDLENLGKLYLGNNSLSKLTPEMLEGLSGLHTLDLKYNKLTSLPNGIFKKMKSLKKLILDGNKITIKKETFEGLDSLEELSLDNCELTTKLANDVFDNLSGLGKLSLRKNPFVDVPIAIKELTKLHYLDLSETNIPEIHSSSFHDQTLLKVIYMEQMPYLYNIQEKAFCGLTSLEELHLSNSSKLYEIHYDAFGQSTGSDYKVMGLKKLDISYCNISILSEDMLYFDEVETLVIGGNPLNCTCETAFLLGTPIYDFVFESPLPKCAYPQNLKGKQFSKVQPTDACPQLRKGKTVWRGIKVLCVLLFLTGVSATLFVLYSKGHLQRFFKNARNGAPAFPSMTYSNLNNTDDGRSLENDFQPRPEEV